MTEYTKQWIAGQAANSFMFKNTASYVETYMNGLIKGIEIAEGFAEWVTWRGIQQSTIPKCYTYQGDTLTTSQLLEQYLIYLKTLEP